MQKFVRLAMLVLICSLMAISYIPANALIVAEPLDHDNADTLEKSLTVNARTLENSIIVSVTFPKPAITESRGHEVVNVGDLPRHGAPGEPVLPIKTIAVLIPRGKELQSIEITSSDKKELKGKFSVEYGKSLVPISSKPSPEVQPKREIYDSADTFPGRVFSLLSKQYLRGHEILLLTLYPVQYIPKMGELYYYRSISLTINLKEAGKTSDLLRNMAKDGMILESIIINPDAVKTYASTTTTMMAQTAGLKSSLVDPSDSYNYVVITDTTLNSSFQPLLDWKIQKGLNATIVMVDDILNEPEYCSNGVFGDGTGTTAFNGTAARIRNFIKDAYANWETEYVLLGGDTQIIPTRGVYAIVNPGSENQEVDYNIPCDMYFGALDGSWNKDNDTVWGEQMDFSGDISNGTAGEEADFYGEVYIGRATVNTPEEVENFVNKTLWYENATDGSYFKKAVMIGERLDEQTEPGNAKDLVTDLIPQYTHKRLYTRDYTYGGGAVVAAINDGTHILNHDGHTNTDVMMDLSGAEVDTVIDNTEYFLGYSVGCYAAAFDAMDCVIEHFIYNPDGAFAFIGNSRYGWYYQGSTNGPGEKFDRAFFRTLNNTARNVGKALQLSKETQLSGPFNRWTYFELNLLGDPEVEIVTEIEAPTAHFETSPSADRLSPPIFEEFVNLTGKARRGNAAGTTFSNFTIEWGKGASPGFWQSTGIELVNNGQDETTDDLLATWDTTQVLGGGLCTLRLTVKDTDGVIGEDRWIVRVQEPPAIRVLPQLTETFEGLTFTLSVELTSPKNLSGLDFQMSWNTTILEYVSHAVYIPWEDYRWGVLYQPVQITHDNVSELLGTYWIAAVSSSASPFERDGTVFNMTFRAKKSGTSNIGIFSSNLTDPGGLPILHQVFNGTVDVELGSHDVATTDISMAKTIVGEGCSLEVNVTVANEGTFPENFNFTVYANATAFNTTQISLEGLSQITIIINWDTTGWTKGNYTISVNAPEVEGETETADNTLINGLVLVTLPGDIDGDRTVTIFDIVRMATIYDVAKPDPRYDPYCDLDNDGIISIFDIVRAATNYDHSW